MSMNGKLAGSNGRLSANFRLKKTKETMHGHGPNSFRKWKRNFLFLWLLCFVSTGIIWFFLSFNSIASDRNQRTLDSCEEKARILLQQFNVSRNQFHALASFFYESDQIAFLECTKHSGPKRPSSDGVACALKVMCSEKQDFKMQKMWVVRTTELKDQCPVQVENIPSEHDLLLDHHNSVSQNSVSLVSQEHHNGEKNILQESELGVQPKDNFENSSFCMRQGCWLLLVGVILSCKISGVRLKLDWNRKKEPAPSQPETQQLQLLLLQQKQQQLDQSPPKGAGKWRKKLLIVFVLLGILTSIWLFWYLNQKIILRREQTLANMCDERARMLQDQFNVSMNHVHALAILVSTFHHGKHPSAIDQKTFGEYTERTSFERPLTSGVAYALKVLHSEREQFEKQHGWTIKKMETEDQTLVQDCLTENLDPAPIKDEYAPVIFSQETVAHIVSIDMMSGKQDLENILRARVTGKGVLTSPFKLLKSNHLGVVLTFAVYNKDLPPDATPEQRTEATVGYLGASYDVPSLVEKLLHQLASKQTIVVNVYDTTNTSDPISMYGTDVTDTGLLRVSNLDFGDPLRKHEMHCRFKQKPPLPWTAINASIGVLVITLLVGHIFHAAICRIAKVENDCREMMELKARAEAADVAKSQFLATVSHEIRTPMNGVLGMLKMLMDTDLDAIQRDYAETAHASGKDLISLINEVLDQAKIESGRLELEDVPFDLRSLLDNVLSLSSDKSNDKGIELAVYVSDRVPEVVVGDPGRFRQIITNLVGNSIKFTQDKGHIFVSVHLVDEVKGASNIGDKVLQQCLNLVQDMSSKAYNTLSGFPVVDRWRSWENFDSGGVLEPAKLYKLKHLSKVEVVTNDPSGCTFTLGFDNLRSQSVAPPQWTMRNIDDRNRLLLCILNICKDVLGCLPKVVGVDIVEMALWAKENTPSVTTQRNLQDGPVATTVTESDLKVSVEKELVSQAEEEDMEALLGTYVMGIGEAEAFSERLKRELHALEAANVHAILESQPLVDEVLQGLEAATSCVDDMDDWLGMFNVKLRHMREDIESIETRNNKLEMQSVNNKALIEELDKLLERLRVPSEYAACLTGGSFDEARMLQNVEACEWLTGALSALQVPNLDPTYAKMRAVKDKRVELEKLKATFVRRASEFLRNYFASLVDFMISDKSYFSQRGQLKRPDHADLRYKCRTYARLLQHLKSLDKSCLGPLRKAYCSSLNLLLRREAREFANELRASTKASRNPTVWLEAATGGSQSGNSSDTSAVSDAYAKMLTIFIPLLVDESSFFAHFMCFEVPALTPPGAVANGSKGGSYDDDTNDDDLGIMDIDDNDSKAGKTSADLQSLNESLQDLLDGIQEDFYAVVDWAYKIDPLRCISMHGITERYLSGQKADAAGFVRLLLGALESRISMQFGRFVDEACHQIERNERNMRQVGVLSYIPRFATLATRMEQYIQGQSRDLVDQAYTKFVSVMFATLEKLAQTDPKYADIFLLENYAAFQNSLYDLANVVPTLAKFYHQASEAYEQACTRHISTIIYYQFERLFLFARKIEDLMFTISAEEIPFQLGLSKMDLRKMLKSSLSGVDKSIAAMYKKLQKNLTSEELLPSLWDKCKKEFLDKYDSFAQLVAKIYPTETIPSVSEMRELLASM